MSIPQFTKFALLAKDPRITPQPVPVVTDADLKKIMDYLQQMDRRLCELSQSCQQDLQGLLNSVQTLQDTVNKIIVAGGF